MSDDEKDDVLTFNGLNATTGQYLIPPVSLSGLRDRAYQLSNQQVWGNADHRDDLEGRADQAAADFRLAAFIDPKNLAATGWGIIFPAAADSAQVDVILEALDDLVKLRQGQAKERYKLYRAGAGYRQGETGREFAARHGVQPGSVRGDKVPYYLLIVADPQSIPFQFQYELDVQFAVGRIYFDTLDEYAQYARSVALAESETQPVQLARRAVFFGVANGVQTQKELDSENPLARVDKATQLSYRSLVQPLYQFATEQSKENGWQVELVAWQDATKARLQRLMGGDQTPALLFTASHGLGFPYGHPGQYPFQGSLVCQDWPGPRTPAGDLPRDWYLGAEDIGSEASLLGSVAFFFACFGAGTPYWDDFAAAENKDRQALAHRAFLAALPRRLLSHPRGGALAVIGHVERAWGYSFKWKGTDAEPESFKDVLVELMAGLPVGHAMEYINDRYATIATDLIQPLDDLRYDKNYDPYKISWLWIANNDARGYAILGDPAVKIPLAPKETTIDIRPGLEAVTHRAGRLPAVLVINSVEATEKTTVQEEIAQHTEATEFSPVAEKPNSSPANDQAGAPVSVDKTPAGVDSAPPTQKLVSQERFTGTQTAPTRPGSLSAMDGLALALQVYTSDAPVNYSMGDDGMSFSIQDDAKNAVKSVVQNLHGALQTLSKQLLDAAEKMLTLEVTTSLVQDLNTFDPLKTDGEKPDVRFKTTISATGNIQVFLPSQAKSIDEVLLQVHKDMVAQALANRTETVKTVGELVASLFTSGK